MVRMFPEQRIAWTSDSYDMIDVRVVDGGGQSAATCTDTWHTEELLTILFKHRLCQTIWAASAITDQVPRMCSTWTWCSMRHQPVELNRVMPKPRV